jgi:hypothetical protein
MKEIIIEVPDNFGKTLKPEKVNCEIKRELIRCKDCKHGCGRGRGIYCQFIECEKTGALHKEDWFCADGKAVK